MVDNSAFIKSLAPKRLDARSSYAHRSISFKFEKPGTVTASLGDTIVLATVSGEISRPQPSNPNEGILSFSITFPPTAKNTMDSENHISQLLSVALKKSKAVDVEGLCIIAGESVWNISTYIHILNDAGNVCDCACIAAITALLHFKRPEVTVDGQGEIIVHSMQDKHPVGLSVHHIPICFTFCLFSDGEIVMLDPSLEEERASQGALSIVVNVHGEVCAISGCGGVGVDLGLVTRCAKIAEVKAQDITRLIREVVYGGSKEGIA